VDADDVVLERLLFLRNEVDYLRGERDQVHSFPAYRENIRLRKATERGLHLAVEACLDIGRRIIALKGFRYPTDNQDVFRVLGEEGIVPAELLPILLDIARFRNLMVHDYAQIDNARVYGILKKRLGDFDAFARAIQIYLEKE
jgi:uncharacterized protein YutE (UPF0331/DUF86 family)